MRKQIEITGFTLIELSIVIVIISLLLAGISVGAGMIHKATLNTVIVDMQNYKTAYSSFEERYRAVPGDMSNAEFYFPTCAVTPGNCNGNGDNIIDYNVFALPDETASAWRELSLANMINTNIEVIPDAWLNQLDPGINIPASKISGAGYLMVGAGKSFGYSGTGQNTSSWDDGITNAVFIGKPGYPTSPYTSGLDAPVLKAEEAFKMDMKIDDGYISGSSFFGANSGKFRSINESDRTASHCEDAGEYNVLIDSVTCISGFALN